MKYLLEYPKRILLGGGVCMAALLLSGCPVYLPPDGGGGNPPPNNGGSDQAEYDEGFDVGFAIDEEYWQGFDDSYDTVDGGTIYYSGSQIPFVEEPPYDAGYWDGVWYAYNDGYFVAYDYAFTVGFSEGYDVAYRSNYAAFLQGDSHLEWLDGGFTDGYNDGFSEGRVFGAFDYANNIQYDWLGAMIDYRFGLDGQGPVDVEIVGVGTGALGPVLLYEWGVDPLELIEGKDAKRKALDSGVPSIRRDRTKQLDADDGISYRVLTPEAEQKFSRTPSVSERSDIQLRHNTSWLERVNAYRDYVGNKSAPQESPRR